MGMRTLELQVIAGCDPIGLALLLRALGLRCWETAFEQEILIAAAEIFLRTTTDPMPTMRHSIFWHFAKQFAKQKRKRYSTPSKMSSDSCSLRLIGTVTERHCN
jgi:hypothetical protein